MKRVVAAGRLEDYWVDTGAFEEIQTVPPDSHVDWMPTPHHTVRVRSMGVGARVHIPGAVGRYVIRSVHDTHEGRMAILADKNGSEFAYPYWDLRPLD